MTKDNKVQYLFRVKLAELDIKKRKTVVTRLKTRLGLKNQAFSHRLRGIVSDVTGYELLVWSQELNCPIDDLFKKSESREMQIN